MTAAKQKMSIHGAEVDSLTEKFVAQMKAVNDNTQMFTGLLLIHDWLGWF